MKGHNYRTSLYCHCSQTRGKPKTMDWTLFCYEHTKKGRELLRNSGAMGDTVRYQTRAETINIAEGIDRGYAPALDPVCGRRACQ